MSYEFQVVVDARDPHAQAAWWAETLGWELEPVDSDFVQSLVDKGLASADDTVVVDGALKWAVGQAIVSDGTPRVLFQLVPEGKTVKNRLHLDVRVGEDDFRSVARSLVDRGATHVYDGRQGPFDWITLTDPEGNEFCVG